MKPGAGPQLSSQLRSHLKRYFPAALAGFQVEGVGLCSREARGVLAVAPGPAAAARLPAARLGSVLRMAGRQRNIEARVSGLCIIFAGGCLHQLPAVEQAMGRQALALVLQLDAACRAADELAEAAAAPTRPSTTEPTPEALLPKDLDPQVLTITPAPRA